jgi:hypothetical protein
VQSAFARSRSQWPGPSAGEIHHPERLLSTDGLQMAVITSAEQHLQKLGAAETPLAS